MNGTLSSRKHRTLFLSLLGMPGCADWLDFRVTRFYRKRYNIVGKVVDLPEAVQRLNDASSESIEQLWLCWFLYAHGHLILPIPSGSCGWQETCICVFYETILSLSFVHVLWEHVKPHSITTPPLRQKPDYIFCLWKDWVYIGNSKWQRCISRARVKKG